MNEQCIELLLNLYKSFLKDQYLLNYLCHDPETLLSSNAHERILKLIEPNSQTSINSVLKTESFSQYASYIPQVIQISAEIQNYKSELEKDINVKLPNHELDPKNILSKLSSSSNSSSKSKKKRRARKRHSKKNKEVSDTVKEVSSGKEEKKEVNIFDNIAEIAKNPNKILEQLKEQVKNEHPNSPNEVNLKNILGDALNLFGKTFNGENSNPESIDKSVDSIKNALSNLMPGFNMDSLFKKPNV